MCYASLVHKAEVITDAIEKANLLVAYFAEKFALLPIHSTYPSILNANKLMGIILFQTSKDVMVLSELKFRKSYIN